MTLLVTGGAGYIGSHTAHALLQAGFKVIVLDNLSTGFKEAIPADAEFVQGDVHDVKLVSNLMIEKKVQAVLHFAAKLIVPESVEKPLEYYDNNVVGTLRLLQACDIAKIRRFIFSSTAAVYGNGLGQKPLQESDPTLPINPYGATKLVSEFQLRDYGQACKNAGIDFRSVVLRYFNVAGAGSDGQRSKVATHLIKIASQVAVGIRPHMQVYGTDYPTEDGTCIRDYIHILDLAAAHVDALQAILADHPGGTFNCGYGFGFSVKKVLDTMRTVTGLPIPAENGPRRAGDPAVLISDPQKIRQELGWRPRHESLEQICKSAYLWEKSLTARKS
jgi:UDP-glucose 4-epimerase